MAPFELGQIYPSFVNQAPVDSFTPVWIVAKEIDPTISHAYPYTHSIIVDKRNKELLHSGMVLDSSLLDISNQRGGHVVPRLIICTEKTGRLEMDMAFVVRVEPVVKDKLVWLDIRADKSIWIPYPRSDLVMWP